MRLPVFPTTEFLFHADRFRQISRDSAGLVQSEAVEKLAAAVTRNDNSRRKNAGSAVSSAADLARLYRDPAEALRAAALYLNLA